MSAKFAMLECAVLGSFLLLSPVTAAARAAGAPEGTASDQRSGLRTWTDVTGGFKTEALFVDFKDERVLLKRNDGIVISVPISNLSDQDREWVKSNAKRNATQGTVPQRERFIAYFVFHGKTQDATENNGPVRLRFTEFRDNALYINGRFGLGREGKEGGYTAVFHTPSLNYGKFTAAILFKAESFDARKTNILTAGEGYRWFGLSRSRAGRLEITLNNAKWSREIETAPLDEGKWTSVVCGADFVARRVVVYFNGTKAQEIRLPARFALEVTSSQEKENEKNWSFTNYGNGTVFHGLVDRLLISNHMLSPGELAGLSHSLSTAR
jgi:hypothetical protein